MSELSYLRVDILPAIHDPDFQPPISLAIVRFFAAVLRYFSPANSPPDSASHHIDAATKYCVCLRSMPPPPSPAHSLLSMSFYRRPALRLPRQYFPNIPCIMQQRPYPQRPPLSTPLSPSPSPRLPTARRTRYEI
jgi:hypothetical protein